MAMGTMKFVPIMFPDFEDLQKTCERFNSWVRQYPLPGKIERRLTKEYSYIII